MPKRTKYFLGKDQCKNVPKPPSPVIKHISVIDSIKPQAALHKVSRMREHGLYWICTLYSAIRESIQAPQSYRSYRGPQIPIFAYTTLLSYPLHLNGSKITRKISVVYIKTSHCCRWKIKIILRAEYFLWAWLA